MPVTRFTLILGLGHCKEAPKEMAQLPTHQVLSPLLLSSRGPDSPVTATAENEGAVGLVLPHWGLQCFPPYSVRRGP